MITKNKKLGKEDEEKKNFNLPTSNDSNRGKEMSISLGKSSKTDSRAAEETETEEDHLSTIAYRGKDSIGSC